MFEEHVSWNLTYISFKGIQRHLIWKLFYTTSFHCCEI